MATSFNWDDFETENNSTFNWDDFETAQPVKKSQPAQKQVKTPAEKAGIKPLQLDSTPPSDMQETINADAQEVAYQNGALPNVPEIYPKNNVIEGRVEKTQPVISANDGKFNKYTNRMNPIAVWKEIKNNPNFLDEQRRMQAGKQLANIYQFENNHPLIAGALKDYMPFYRSYKSGLEFDRTHGTNATLGQAVGETAKEGALNLIPSVNLLSAYYTGGLNNLPLAGVIDGGIQGLTSAIGDVTTEGADINELWQRPLQYSAMGALGGYGLNQLANGAKYVKNLNRRIDVAKRRNTSVYDRMTPEQIERATTPQAQPSQYGVAEINSAQNKAIASQIENNINAENELLREYKQLHSDMTKKYGSIEELKNQAVKEFDRVADTGEVSEALNDYRNLIAYENELGNAKYVSTNIKNSSNREMPVVNNITNTNVNQKPNVNKYIVNNDTNIGTFYDIHNNLISPEPDIYAGEKSIKGVMNYLGSKDGNIAEINTPIGAVKVARKNAFHLIRENEPERSNFINRFVLTLKEPNLIVNSNREGNNYDYYIKLFEKSDKTKSSHVQIVKIAPDGNFYVTNHHLENGLFKNLIKNGQIKYDLSDLSAMQKIASDNNIIPNSVDNFNSSIKTGNKGQSQLALSDDVANTIGKQDVEYNKLSNAELTAQAQNDIANNAEIVKSNLMTKSTGKEQLSALDFEQGRQLLDKLYSEGRTQEAIDLVEVLSKKGSEAGQAVQAMSLWSKTTPEGAELFAQRTIDKYNKLHPKNKITLSAEERAEIRQMAQDINTAEDKNFATQLMMKKITDKIPVSALQKIKTLRNISLLLNPKTLVRNVAGNAIFATAEKGSQALAAGIDKGISLLTGKRTRALPQVGKYFSGMGKGINEGIRDVQAGVDTRGLGQRFDLPNGRSFNGGVLGKLEEALDYGLRVPDRAFYQAAFDESVANQLAAQGLKEPTQEILEQANKEALEAVFQNEGVISNAVLQGRKALNTIGTPELGLGDFVIPYAQTPANLVQQGINYSPLGLGKAAMSFAQGNQRQGTMDLARAILGSGVMGAGYGLAKNGIATGEYADKQQRENLQAINDRPYSINIGDLGISYNQLQPMSVPFSAGVTMATGESPINAAVNTLVEMPFMDNLNQFVKDNSNYGIGEAILRQGASYPTQFVPTSLNQINTYVDPYYRETYDPNNAVSSLKRGVAKIPGASYMLPKKTDVRGQEVKKDLNPLNVFLNPVFVNKREDDSVMNEILRLQSITGENTLLPLVKRKITGTDKQGNKIDKKLTSQEYATYKTKLGKKGYSMIADIMNTDMYQQSDDTTKAEIIKSVKEDVNALVEGDLFNKKTKYDKTTRKTNKNKTLRNKAIKGYVENKYSDIGD